MADFSRWKTPGWAFSDALVNNVPSYTERQQNERELAMKALVDKANMEYNSGILQNQDDRLAFDMSKEMFDQSRLSRGGGGGSGGGGGTTGSLFFRLNKTGDHEKTDRAKNLDSILERMAKLDKDGNPITTADGLSYNTKRLLWEYQKEAGDYGFPVELPADMQGYGNAEDSVEGYSAPALEGDLMPVETPGGTYLGQPEPNPQVAPPAGPAEPEIDWGRINANLKKKYPGGTSDAVVERELVQMGVPPDVARRAVDEAR